MALHGDFGEAPTVAGGPLGTGGGGTPDAHAASHASGGTDPVTLAESQVTNLSTDLAAKAPLASPTFTGTPTAPTAGAGVNSIQIATTAYVVTAVAGVTTGFAPLNSPAFTGAPTAPTAAPGDNDTSIATTAFVTAAVTAGATGYAPLASPAFTGNPTAPTASLGDADTSIATTAFVAAAVAGGVSGGSTDPVNLTRSTMSARKLTGATTLSVSGQATAGALGTATTADDADGPWVNLATATTLNAIAAAEGASGAFVRADWLPDLTLKIKTPASVATSGYWVGLSTSTGAVAGTGGTALLAAFRYYTDTDGTAFWRCVTKDTTGATLTVTTTSVAVAVDTAYTLRVKIVSSASVEFYAQGALVATHTTNVPPPATSLDWVATVLTLNAGTASNLKVSRMWMSHL